MKLEDVMETPGSIFHPGFGDPLMFIYEVLRKLNYNKIWEKIWTRRPAYSSPFKIYGRLFFVLFDFERELSEMNQSFSISLGSKSLDTLSPEDQSSLKDLEERLREFSKNYQPFEPHSFEELLNNYLIETVRVDTIIGTKEHPKKQPVKPPAVMQIYLSRHPQGHFQLSEVSYSNYRNHDKISRSRRFFIASQLEKDIKRKGSGIDKGDFRPYIHRAIESFGMRREVWHSPSFIYGSQRDREGKHAIEQAHSVPGIAEDPLKFFKDTIDVHCGDRSSTSDLIKVWTGQDIRVPTAHFYEFVPFMVTKTQETQLNQRNDIRIKFPGEFCCRSHLKLELAYSSSGIHRYSVAMFDNEPNSDSPEIPDSIRRDLIKSSDELKKRISGGTSNDFNLNTFGRHAKNLLIKISWFADDLDLNNLPDDGAYGNYKLLGIYINQPQPGVFSVHGWQGPCFDSNIANFVNDIVNGQHLSDYRPFVNRMVELYAQIPKKKWQNPNIYNSKANLLSNVIEALFSESEAEKLKQGLNTKSLVSNGWASIPHLSLGLIRLPGLGQNDLSQSHIVLGSSLLVEALSRLNIMPREEAEAIIGRRLEHYFVHQTGFQYSREMAIEVVNALRGNN